MLLAALLAAVTATAAPVRPARPPDGAYTYTLFLAGARTGARTVTIEGSGDTMVVGENADFSVPKVRATTTMRYDRETPREAVHQYLTVPARIDPRVTSALIAWLAAVAQRRVHGI